MEISGSPSTSSMTSKSSLSSEIYLLKLIESHSLEIDSLNTECKTKLPKLLSQRLPRFMRRRASSHNPKRVPKSVRLSNINKTEASLKKSKDTKSKNNKKKYVNKKKSELSLKRRQQKTERSVLHVWFAKRFQMKMYWNCLIPEKNSTKNERILYKNSKNDFVFYYLSHYGCLEIDYSKSDRQQLISFLSKFVDSQIGCTFGAKIYESEKREGITLLYDYNSYPFKPLVSSYFLWNNTYSKLWIWIHISVYDKVFQLLTDCSQTDYSQKFQFNRKTKQLERFRLIGPKSIDLLANRLKFEINEIKYNESSEDFVYYLRSIDNNISFIDSNQTTLFEDIHESKQKSSNIFDFILILKYKTYNNRFTTDLIVSSISAKTLWHKIVENRVHRSGGMQDLKMIAFNTSSLLFPSFGFIDAEVNQIKMQKLKNLLEIESNEELYVIRSDLIVSKLSKNMSLMTVTEVLDSIKDKNSLINVEVICVERGVPEEFDYICVPTEEEIQSFINKTNDRNIREETEKNENSVEIKRKTIGLIEFGKYSLEISRGKGLGIITITSLKELIEINDRIRFKNKNYKNNKIFASFKSLKSGLYRIVTIKVIDSIFST